MTRDPRRAYRVVDDFEAELADYTGAPFAVAVDSCTNALLLALTYERIHNDHNHVGLPRHTYVGVLHAALNAGYTVRMGRNGLGRLVPALAYERPRRRHIPRGRRMNGKLVCLSFHAAKQLPLGRGGAILTDDEHAAEWLRAARMDGRPPGTSIEQTRFPGYHCPMRPTLQRADSGSSAAGTTATTRRRSRPRPTRTCRCSTFSSSTNRAESNAGPSRDAARTLHP